MLRNVVNSVAQSRSLTDHDVNYSRCCIAGMGEISNEKGKVGGGQLDRHHRGIIVSILQYYSTTVAIKFMGHVRDDGWGAF